MVLRADPAGSAGLNVCRVYSPEINTKDKLRKELAKELGADDTVDEQISESTLQRMIDSYLKAGGCRIVFSQNDHNACPNCKTLKYAVLQYHHQEKQLQKLYEKDFDSLPRPFEKTTHEESERMLAELRTKQYQEKESLKVLNEHTMRDASIRKTVKAWGDHFRSVENDYRKNPERLAGGWNSLSDHAIITHQDDMTKVDLPHFVTHVSGELARWRFDINAHVSSVNDDCVIFSREQGTGSKNSSAIAEMIILDHLVRCRGEAIKVVVSDKASVGKNWLTTITLPQYFVDQGLADIVVIVFLENNHGKWLADMLFGQVQTRRKRTTLLSVDDLLSEFTAINRKSENVHGFAANPLSSIAFADVFQSL